MASMRCLVSSKLNLRLFRHEKSVSISQRPLYLSIDFSGSRSVATISKSPLVKGSNGEAVGHFRTANPRVFGPVLYGTDRHGSDIDLLVDALPGATLLFHHTTTHPQTTTLFYPHQPPAQACTLYLEPLEASDQYHL